MKQIDFLIIGGGVGGTSAGAALSEHGHVVVLEGENSLGYHASGRSAALFEQSYGKPSTVALNKAVKVASKSIKSSKIKSLSFYLADTISADKVIKLPIKK